LTYPKDGERKLKEENKQLRMQVSRLRKENEILRQERERVGKLNHPKKQKPIQEDPADDKPKDMSMEEWRKNFVKEFRIKPQKG
jgi:hypothetical protein